MLNRPQDCLIIKGTDLSTDHKIILISRALSFESPQDIKLWGNKREKEYQYLFSITCLLYTEITLFYKGFSIILILIIQQLVLLASIPDTELEIKLRINFKLCLNSNFKFIRYFAFEVLIKVVCHDKFGDRLPRTKQ